jgi:rubrerythrin
MTRQDAFRIAIEAEIRAQNLYRALGKSFKNEETEQFFDQLVKYEEYHEEKMRELFAKEFPQMKLELTQEPDIELRGVKLDDPKALLEFAISREELAQNIYQTMAEQSEDSSIRDLLLRFANEEQHHKELLFAEIEKLHGTLQWFDPSELDGFMEH